MVGVVSINNPKVDETMVKLLEELLGEAKTGNLQSLMFVDKYQDGSISHGWSGVPDNQMIGQFEELKFDLYSQMYLSED